MLAAKQQNREDQSRVEGGARDEQMPERQSDAASGATAGGREAEPRGRSQ